MTLKKYLIEIKEEKKKLKKRILEEIKSFEEKTGLEVREISLYHFPPPCKKKFLVIQTKLDRELIC